MASIRQRDNGQRRARYRDDAGKATVRQYAAQRQAAQVWRGKTARRVETSLRVHILPAIGDRAIASVRQSDIQGLVKGLYGTLAASSVKVTYSTVRSMFKAAVDDRELAASPCVRVKLPSGERKQRVIPSVETVHGIGERLGQWRVVVYVAAGLGLRPGEVFGLKVSDVDFLRRTVQLSRHLEQHRRQGLVFVGQDGGAVKRNTFSKVWRCAAGDLRLHDCRHVYASALINAGESVKTVQRRLGDASAAMTLDVYIHLWPESDERFRAAIDSYLGTPADSLQTGEA